MPSRMRHLPMRIAYLFARTICSAGIRPSITRMLDEETMTRGAAQRASFSIAAKSIAPMKLFSVGSGVPELPSIFTITLSATSVM